MQKGDRVIVADLSLSLPLCQCPYFGRANRLGHHDGVVAHVRGIGHSARLRHVERFRSRRHAPAHNRDRQVLHLRCNHRGRYRRSADRPNADLLEPGQHLGRVGVDAVRARPPLTARPVSPVRSARRRNPTLPAWATTPVPSPVTDKPADHELYGVPSSLRILRRRNPKFPLPDRHFRASTRKRQRSPVNDAGSRACCSDG